MTRRSYRLTPEREKQIEEYEITTLFGEVDSGVWCGYAWHYTGVPEWAGEDFDDLYESTYHTVIVTGGGFLPNPEDKLTDDDGTWELVRTYTASGETECPGRMEESQRVTRDQAVLVKRWPKGFRAECPHCEARIGEEHGCIYLGESYEAVYRLVEAEADPCTDD
jgi:hypothetical protein